MSRFTRICPRHRLPVSEAERDGLLRCPAGHFTSWVVLDREKQRVVGASSGVGGLSEDSIRRSRAQTSAALRREAARKYEDMLRDLGRRR